jgi:hypothetical protein
MAGTFTDQATLAADAAFIGKVKIAMITRAIEQYYNATAQPYSVLAQAKNILETGAGEVERMAWLCVAADANIKAAAPAVPSDAATQTIVNTVLTALLK